MNKCVSSKSFLCLKDAISTSYLKLVFSPIKFRRKCNSREIFKCYEQLRTVVNVENLCSIFSNSLHFVP